MKTKSLLVLTLFLVGCGTTTTLKIPKGYKVKVNVAGEIYVEVPTKKNASTSALGPDILTKMKTSLESQLLKRCFKVARVGKGKYVLKTTILTYEPGSALKRWIMPGWGATLLRAKSSLAKGADKKTIAEIDFDGNVTAGGFYTVGADKYIVDWFGEELAKKLREAVGGRSDCATAS